MSLLKDVIGYGLHADRPAPGSEGRLYYETDTSTLFRDNGTVWNAMSLTNPMSAQDDLIVGGASGAAARLAKGTDGQVLTVDPTTHHLLWATPAAGGSGLYTAYLCYQEQQASGTQSGTFTSGAWQTRVLTTEVADTGNHGTLASNQVTLDAGTYRACASAPAFAVYQNQLRLQNVSDSATLLTGAAAYADATGSNGGVALLSGRFTLGAAKTLELQHRCNTTRATNGFGVPCGFGTEVYATLELWKE